TLDEIFARLEESGGDCVAYELDPLKENLDDAYRCDVVAAVGDGRRPRRSPLGLGVAAGTHCAARASPTCSGRERGDRRTLPTPRSRGDRGRRVRTTATTGPVHVATLTPPLHEEGL